jgi:hypothetical protein
MVQMTCSGCVQLRVASWHGDRGGGGCGFGEDRGCSMSWMQPSLEMSVVASRSRLGHRSVPGMVVHAGWLQRGIRRRYEDGKELTVVEHGTTEEDATLGTSSRATRPRPGPEAASRWTTSRR